MVEVPQVQLRPISNVRLRPVEPGDLPTLFEFQLDEPAHALAATHARDQADFDSHWSKIINDAAVTVRTILADDAIAGSIACFEANGRAWIGYWIGAPFRRRGIATLALRLFLHEVTRRPLHASVAAHNAGSIRVLEKCGFAEVDRHHSPATDRFRECEAVTFEL